MSLKLNQSPEVLTALLSHSLYLNLPEDIAMTEHPKSLSYLPRTTRRRVVAMGAAVGIAGAGVGASGLASAISARRQVATPVTPVTAESIAQIGKTSLDELSLRSVILRVVQDGKELVTAAYGESLPGVPATVDMHFRNGAVAISYLSTLLLVLVDDGICALEDPLAKWLPKIADADRVTLRMLANMTSGYRDYVYEPAFLASLYVDPFRQVTREEQLAASFKLPRIFEPGTNWEYAHTNYVILGQAPEVMTGQPMATLMQKRTLDPLGLRNTTGSATPAIPEPVLHAYTSERREALGIDPTIQFYEESTFWNPSWTLAKGAIQTTNIFDMTASAIAIGEGTLLSPASHAEQVSPKLVGFGAPLKGCASCHTLTDAFSYGLGVVLRGPWILQNPMFSGFAATEGYLPSHKLAIAVSVTFSEASFDKSGNSIHGNASTIVFDEIAAALVPDNATPKPA